MMKNKIILLLCLFVAFVNVRGQGINFERGSFSEALEKARKEKKMVFVDAFAVWCGPCRWMEKNVFTDPVIGKYFDENFVAVKIDVEKGEGPSIRTRYAIEGLPGYLFLDSDGNVVHQERGKQTHEKFMAIVKTAQVYAADTNNVGRMAAGYELNKTNEKYVSAYLNKLKSSGSGGYYDVVEQYLKIQKSMDPSGGEMVKFLYDHRANLVFGGIADEILKKNLWTDKWDLYVRKNIRDAFQKLPQKMAEQTTEYAILKKDTALLDVSIARMEELGLKFQPGQKERLLRYYYFQTNEGPKYMQLVRPQIEEYYESLDVAHLQQIHKNVLVQKQKNPERKIRSFAETKSEKLRFMVIDYAKFASAEDDKKLVLKWADRVYEILPDDISNAAFYAKILYLFGDDKEKSLLLMKGLKEKCDSDKQAATLARDYEEMKSGNMVIL